MACIYVIGDLHLSFDERISKPMDIFGPEWADHPERLKKNWEGQIREDDFVLIPGDISWGLKLDEAMRDLEWVHNLPGRKILTKGNHDLWWTSVTKLNALYEDMTFLQNRAVQIGGTDTFVCGTRGWICPSSEGFDEHDDKVFRREILRLRMSLDDARANGAGEIIAMLHYPPTNDKFQRSGFTDTLREYGVRTCVYGHLHGRDNFRRGIQGHFNGVDYRLASLDYLGCRPLRIR